MRKINKWLMVCVCALFSLTGCYNTEPRENVLKIYNWADYIDEDVLAEFPRWYKEQGLPVVYEENPGNHFQDAVNRMAKGIAWILQ